jgi:hypothetical protein
VERKILFEKPMRKDGVFRYNVDSALTLTRHEDFPSLGLEAGTGSKFIEVKVLGDLCMA